MSTEMNGVIDLSGDGGVLKKILQEGIGEDKPSAGCKAALHYTGTLIDGSKFDSSLDRNEKFEFELGKGVVIKAFDLGVASMRQNEKAILTCAPEYAYGESGSPPNIPPNATLMFELELFGWKQEDLSPQSNGAILRTIVKKATSRSTPSDGATVTAHIVGEFEGRQFDDRTETFTLGETLDEDVIYGIQTALTHFGKGETSRLTILPEFAFGDKGHVKFGIPPNATVKYTVTLTDFEREAQSWKLDAAQSLAQAKLIKDKATQFVKNEKYSMAVKLYEKSNTYLSNISNKNEPNSEAQKVKAAVYLNIALCYMKVRNYGDARRACEHVLEIDSTNVKAYYRRGSCHFALNEVESALADFHRVLDYDPNNKAAQNQVTLCKQAIKDYNEQQKQLYANMFAKFAEADLKNEPPKPDELQFESCGEWNNDFVAQNAGIDNMAEVQAQANRVLDDVNKHVVML